MWCGGGWWAAGVVLGWSHDDAVGCGDEQQAGVTHDWAPAAGQPGRLLTGRASHRQRIVWQVCQTVGRLHWQVSCWLYCRDTPTIRLLFMWVCHEHMLICRSVKYFSLLICDFVPGCFSVWWCFFLPAALCKAQTPVYESLTGHSGGFHTTR